MDDSVVWLLGFMLIKIYLNVYWMCLFCVWAMNYLTVLKVFNYEVI